MQVKELRAGLGKLADLLSQWQAKSGLIDDLSRLDQLLAAHDELNVASFCERVERALAGQPAVAPKQPAPAIKDAVVSAYLEELRQSERDHSAFGEVLRRLDRDKKARLQEVLKIASEYVGVDVGSIKKTQALDQIRYRQRNVTSPDQRNRNLSGIF